VEFLIFAFRLVYFVSDSSVLRPIVTKLIKTVLLPHFFSINFSVLSSTVFFSYTVASAERKEPPVREEAVQNHTTSH